MKTQPSENENLVKEKEIGQEHVELPSFSLPPSVVKLLNEEDSIAWTTDYQYFEGILAVEQTRILPYSLSAQHRQSFFTVTSENTLFASVQDPVSQKARRLEDLLKEMLQSLETKLQNKMQAMEHRPFVEKLLDAFEATDIQRRVFRHVLARSSGMIVSNEYNNDEKDSISRYLNEMAFQENYNRNSSPSVPIMELLELFCDQVSLTDIVDWTDSSKSVWVKEQIYADSSSSNIPLPCVQISAMDRTAITCLMGLKIKPAQYKALTSSLLQEILMEHKPFLETPTGQILLQKKETKQEALDIAKTQTTTAPSALSQALKDNELQANHKRKERLYDVLSLATTNDSSVAKETEKKDDSLDDKDVDMVSESLDATPAESIDGDEVAKQAKDEWGAYESELAYLEDQVILMEKDAELLRIKYTLDNLPSDENEAAQGLQDSSMAYLERDSNYYDRRGNRMDSNYRFKQMKKVQKLEQQIKQLKEKIETKITTSRLEKGVDFRLEQLCDALELCKFEKHCILIMVKSVIMPNKVYGQPQMMLNGAEKTRVMEVGALINKFCGSLEDRMQSRRFFYKSSTLIREGILTISGQDFLTDLSNCNVELDRRLFDYIVGLDTEMSEVVNGSHLYLPDVEVDDVILPETMKKRICEAVLGFDAVKDEYERLEADKKYSYGLGQVILLYGQSGTGKTMMANALASKLQKKILLVNFPDLGGNNSGAIIKYLFREARINRALLFFDEAESMFLDRNKGGKPHLILTELERFDGLCILATNRAYDLDEAMHRRISLAVEFKKPDHLMREKIWKSLKPPKLELEDSVSFPALAKKYELVGGTIKNAWLQSLHHMVQRNSTTVSQDDLEKAAGEQVRGQLSMENFDRRVIPTCGIDSMVLAPSIKDALTSVVQYSKAQNVLFGQWGFEKVHRSTTGISVLFTGSPGTGKSMASEAIGFDLGKPLLVVNVAELVSKYVGETGKNIQAIFADAKAKDAVLVFDEAEGLFGSREGSASSSVSRHDTMNVGLLLQYIENFTGVSVVITNMKDAIDEAFLRRFRFVLDFQMPTASERELIWKTMIPKECPLSPDVRLQELAGFEMCGGDIKNALLRAATTAALRAGEKNIVTMKDLKDACHAEMEKRGKKGSLEMYS